MQQKKGGAPLDVSVTAARIALLPRSLAGELYGSNDVRGTIEDIFRRYPLARAAVALTSGLAFTRFEAERTGNGVALSRTAMTVARSLIRMSTRCTPAGLSASIGPVRRSAHWTYPRRDDELRRRAIVRVDAEVLASAYEHAQSELSAEIRIRTNPSIRRAAGRLYVVAGPEIHATSGAAPVSIRSSASIEELLRSCARSRRVGDLVAEIAASRSASVEDAREYVEQLVRHGYLLTNQYPDLLRDLTADALERLPPGPLRERVETAAEGSRALERRIAIDPASLTPAELDKHAHAIDLFHGADDLAVGPSFDAALERYVRLMIRNARRIEQRRLRRAFEQRYEGRTEAIPLLEFAGVAMSTTSEAVTDEARQRAADRLAATALAHCEREGVDEYALDADQLAALVGDFEFAPGDELELGVRIVARDTDALERGEFRLAPALYLGASTAYASLGRFGYAFAGEPWAEQGRAGAFEIVGDLSPKLWHLGNREMRVRGAIRQRPNDSPNGEELTLADLYVRMDESGVLRIVDRTGFQIPLSRTHLLSLPHSSAVIRVLEYIAADGRIEARPFFPEVELPHVPRLVYGDIIIAPARWRVARETVLDEASFSAYRERHRVSNLIAYGFADRQLHIDLSSLLGRALLAREAARGGRTLDLREAEAGTGNGLPYASEIVVEVSAPQRPAPVAKTAPARTFGIPAVSLEWTYVKLFGPAYADDDMCVAFIPEIVRTLSADDATPWHFLRYSDPAHHVRVRVRNAARGAVCSTLELLREWTLRGDIERWQIDTYEPEFDRYGGADGMRYAQRVFHADSRCVIDVLRTRIPNDRDRTVIAAETFAVLVGLDEPDAPMFATLTPGHRGDARSRASLRAVDLTRVPSPETAAAALGVPAGWLAAHYEQLFHLHCNRFGLDRENERDGFAYLRALAVKRRARTA